MEIMAQNKFCKWKIRVRMNLSYVCNLAVAV